MPIAENQARVNVTWKGQQGDLPDPVAYDAANGDVFQWVTEAVRAGDVPGIDADPDANFANFVVDRFDAHEEVPYNRLVVRPKTAYGLFDSPRLPRVRVPVRALAMAAFFARYDDAEEGS